MALKHTILCEGVQEPKRKRDKRGGRTRAPAFHLGALSPLPETPGSRSHTGGQGPAGAFWTCIFCTAFTFSQNPSLTSELFMLRYFTSLIHQIICIMLNPGQPLQLKDMTVVLNTLNLSV